MNAFRRHLQAFARTALLAMCALVLLPSSAQAWSLGAEQHAQTEICTPQGLRLVAPDVGSEAPQARPGHGEHCPFCAQPGTLLVPPAEVVLLVLPPAGAAAAPLFLPAPRTLPAWRAAHPRGPPGRA